MNPPQVNYRCLCCGYAWRHTARLERSWHSGRVIGYTLAADCPNCEHLYLEKWSG